MRLEKLHYPHAFRPDAIHGELSDATDGAGDDDDGDGDDSDDARVYTSYNDDQDSPSEYGSDDPDHGATGDNGDNDYETTTTIPIPLTTLTTPPNDKATALSRLSPQHTEQHDEGDADNPNNVTKCHWPKRSSFSLLQLVRVPQEFGVLFNPSQVFNGLLGSVDPEGGTGYVTFDDADDGEYAMRDIGCAVLVYLGIECRLRDVNIVDGVSGLARLAWLGRGMTQEAHRVCGPPLESARTTTRPSFPTRVEHMRTAQLVILLHLIR